MLSSDEQFTVSNRYLNSDEVRAAESLSSSETTVLETGIGISTSCYILYQATWSIGTHRKHIQTDRTKNNDTTELSKVYTENEDIPMKEV